MSKKFRFFAAICLFLISVASFAESFEVGGIYYKTDYKDKTIAIVTSGDNKYAGEVIIPETVAYNGSTLKVTTIGSSAFSQCTGLTSVKIPNSITTIEFFAFNGCSGITTIALPNSILRIGDGAFSGCKNLLSIEIPNSIVEMGNSVFSSSGIQSVVWPQNVKVIPDGTFSSCTGLKSYDISDNITNIGSRAFSSCSNLVSVYIGKNVRTIGDDAFDFCSALESINIPTSARSIGKQSFYYCKSLKEIVLNDGLESIGSEAFRNTGFQSITIPRTVKYVGVALFADCGNLKSISVEKSNGHYCDINGVLYSAKKDTIIAYPSGLGDEYAIPNDTKAIGDYAFYRTNIKVVSLNEGLEYIGEKAFGSTQIESIEIPSTVSKFGEYIFEFQRNLKSIISKIDTPKDILKTVFDYFSSGSSIDNIYNECVLYVPEGTSSKYKAANGWKEFKNIEETGLHDANGFRFEIDYASNTATLVKKNNSYYSGYLTIPDEFAYGGNTIAVTGIGESAFANCSDLIQIEICKNIKSIGDNAFKGCYKLEHITSLIPTPISISDNVFSDVYDKATLLVPMEKKGEYEKADGWKNFKTIREIENNTNYSYSNSAYSISFLTDLKAGTAKVTYIQNDQEHVDIPEQISVYGYNLTVNEIASTIFKYAKKDTLQSISFPATLTKVDNSIFGDCPKLSAIIWNSSTRKPEDDLVKNIANPNLLFYVPTSSVRPNYIKNIIVNESADEITLVNHENGNFYCPKEFLAKKITYTHNYSMKTVIGRSQGWETIVLPFDVQRYKTEKGDVYPFAAGVSDRIFWLREMTGTGFVNASEIKANTPYIISMPNSDWYQDIYNITGNVEFYSENILVKESSTVNNVSLGSRQFIPSYQYKASTSDTYVLNVNNSEIEYTGSDASGSVFIRNLRTIHPFECYIEDKVSQARAISIGDFVTGIDDISLYNSQDNVYAEGGIIIVESTSVQKIPIYNISGQLVRNFKVKVGKNEISGLPSGLYVIKGRKFVVM